MALNNFANLKQAVQRFAKREDLSAVEDDFITLAESFINKRLRIAANNVRSTTTLTTTSRFVEKPIRFLEMRRLTIIDGDYTYDVKYRTPDQMEIEPTKGRPEYFTITGEIELNRVPSSAWTLEMSYWTRLTPLSTSNTTNNTLTNYPDIYLNAALMQVHLFARDEELAEYYKSRTIELIDDTNTQESSGLYGPNPAMMTEGVTP